MGSSQSAARRMTNTLRLANSQPTVSTNSNFLNSRENSANNWEIYQRESVRVFSCVCLYVYACVPVCVHYFLYVIILSQQISPDLDETPDWINETVTGSFTLASLVTVTSNMMQEIEQEKDKLSSLGQSIIKVLSF